jgi:hypothetical protein
MGIRRNSIESLDPVNLETQLDSCVAGTGFARTVKDWSAHMGRWPLYAAATSAALAMATSADANVISGFSGQTVHIGGHNSSSNATVRFGGLGSLEFGLIDLHFASGPQSTRLGAARIFPTVSQELVTTGNRGARMVKRLERGSAMNSGSFNFVHFSGQLHQRHISIRSGNLNFNTSRGNWPASQTGFAGFKLANGFPATMEALSWAVDTVPGQSIIAGETPEPGTAALALLALGAGGVVAWHKSRRNTAQSFRRGEQ